MLILLFLLGLVTKETNQNYINHDFDGPITPEQSVTSTDNIQQISGCRFTNIQSPNKNYYFRIDSNPVEIFDNIFENTIESTNYPAIFWVQNNQNQIKIKNCTFIKIVGKSGTDGNILNSDSSTLIIFEGSKFYNCGIGSNKALVDFKNINKGIGSCQFIKCLFYFDDSTKSSQIVLTLSSEIIFDECEFHKCNENAIEMNIQTTSTSTSTGNFEFKNNIVKDINYKFITGHNIRGTINIENNTFENIFLTDNYFIELSHDQENIEIKYNTFSNIEVEGTTSQYFGGISTYLKCTTSTEYSIIYKSNKFYDIINSYSNSPFNYGGCIQIGFIDEFKHISISFLNCEFKRNKTPKHGGSIAIETYGTIQISNCTFENNIANYEATNKQLLTIKQEGRGGAIFISSVKTDTSSTGDITIENCLFRQNEAFDGFSIYFEGDELETVPSIINNKFYNNYNNIDDSPNHGCITSEILNVDKTMVEEKNDFSNNELGAGTEKFIYVSNSGEKLPDPSSTPQSTPAPTMTPIVGSNSNFIDKTFEGIFSFGQAITSDLTIKQISGCRFTNIESSNKNYYFRIDSNPVEIFDNIFENTIESTNYPAIFWVQNNQNQIKIKNCTFIKIVGKSGTDGNILNSDSSTLIIFEGSKFYNCGIGSNKALIDFKNINKGIGSCQFIKCLFYFDDSTKSSQIVLTFSSEIIFDECEFHKCNENAIEMNIQTTSTSTSTGNFEFKNNIVKDINYKFITGHNIRGTINIENNTFENIFLTDNYFIELSHDQENIEIKYNTFSNIEVEGTSSQYFGGISTYLKCTNDQLTSKSSITYDHCNFYNIINSYTSSPSSNGGAAQFGFSSEINQIDLTISNCHFKCNKATKHGGAVAIQTLGSVTIQNCIFEDNRANYIQSSTCKMLEDKAEGRGGALFISTGNADNHIEKLFINQCTFKRNIAYDAYSIYIEGEQSDAVFEITENKFIDNYNIADALSTGACFACEITSIAKDQIESENTFSNIYDGLDSKKFYHVDQFGNPLPDPSPLPTPNPTPFQEFINKEYFGPFSYGQAVTSTLLIQQISGCRFTNIESSNKNYYFRIDSNPVEIFDNIFENTIESTNYPAIFWVQNNQNQIKIKNCTFIKIVGKSGTDGNILNSDSSTLIIFEGSKFYNCGIGSNKALVDFKDTNRGIGSCQFIKCLFYFDDSTKSSQIVLTFSSEIIFDECEFHKCNENAIEMNIQTTSTSTSTGNFEFKNNIVKDIRYKFITGHNIRGTINIENNTFENIFLTDNYFIELSHDQENIEIKYNTFSNIEVEGTTSQYFGGISTYLKCTTSTEYSIIYKSNKFYDIINSYSNSPFNYGGCIQIGFIDEFKHISISFLNCEFKRNKTPKHGGSIAIETYGTIQISNCTFENNIANYEATNKQLLTIKQEGRGGAIFISLGDKQSCTSSVTIDQCTFDKNMAYDGFAIYIEGVECETSFSIIKNKFNNNYNTDGSPTTGACIASEILLLDSDNVISNNEFINSEYGTESKKFVYVYQSGIHIPEQSTKPFSLSYLFTKSKKFTHSGFFSETNEFSQSKYFSNSAKFSYSNDFSKSVEFSYSNAFSSSEKFSQSNDFSKSVEFSYSDAFSSSEKFSQSSQFSKSGDFSHSDAFTESDELSQSNYFSQSGEFSQSHFFLKSEEFSFSFFFSKSDKFSFSHLFSFSNQFTKSNYFTESQHFTISESLEEKISSDFVSSPHEASTNSFITSMQFTSFISIDNFDGNETELMISSTNKKKNKMMIISIVIGVVVIVAIVIIVVVILLIKKKNKINETASKEHSVETNASMYTVTTSSENINPLYDNDTNLTRYPFDSDFDE